LPILLIVLAIVILGAGAYLILMTDKGRSLVGLSTSPTGNLGNLSVETPTEEPIPESVASLINDNQRKSDIREIQTALEAYGTDKGSFPISETYSRVDSPDSDIYTALVSGGYLTSMPTDPLAPDYWYGYKSVDGESYILTARLEDESDPEGVIRGDIVLYQVTNLATLWQE
jgi:hypothetical protein